MTQIKIEVVHLIFTQRVLFVCIFVGGGGALCKVSRRRGIFWKLNFLQIFLFQVLLRSLLQRGIIAITKSITPARVKENFEVSLLLYPFGRLHEL
jgi:hypothetical protein